MTAYAATKGSPTTPVGEGIGGPVANVIHSTFEIETALEANDTIDMFWLPKCEVVWGFLQGDDLDSGTETLELDVGHPANSDYNGSESADPDRFLDSGVISGDAVAGVSPAYAGAGMFWLPFNGLKDGPVSLTGYKTLVQVTATAAAATGHLGTLYLCAFFATGQS